jgi:5-methylcytosine-specific restriction endonuclease McrA
MECASQMGSLPRGITGESPSRSANVNGWLRITSIASAARARSQRSSVRRTPPIFFWLRKHGIPRRSISAARKIKHWGPRALITRCGTSAESLTRAGSEALRQSGRRSTRVKSGRDACSHVWKRDGARCRRCDMRRDDSPDMPFHIHHIVSFADKKLRSDPSNLVLLCEACHQFVHSRRNVNREFLPEKRAARASA